LVVVVAVVVQEQTLPEALPAVVVVVDILR
jgi:hypothetical protein